MADRLFNFHNYIKIKTYYPQFSEEEVQKLVDFERPMFSPILMRVNVRDEGLGGGRGPRG